MTVQKLIHMLGFLQPDTLVMVKGYEGGVTELTPENVILCRVALDFNGTSGLCGKHEALYEDDNPTDEWSPYKDSQIVNAVVLSR